MRYIILVGLLTSGMSTAAMAHGDHYAQVEKRLSSAASHCTYKVGFDDTDIPTGDYSERPKIRTDKIRAKGNSLGMNIEAIEKLVYPITSRLLYRAETKAHEAFERAIIQKVLDKEVGDDDEAFVAGERNKFIETGMKFYRAQNELCQLLSRNEFGGIFIQKRSMFFDYDSAMPDDLRSRFDFQIYDDVYEDE